MNFQQLIKYAPTTFMLLLLIVGYFIVQFLMGVNIDSPSAQDLVKYGANFLPFSLNDEPWRLLSSGFLHIGLMHLLFNGFALYYFGQVLEQIMGAWRFLALFLLSVVGGNLLNLSMGWYNALNHNTPPVIAAGASGGIMGLGSALLLISFSKLPVATQLNKRGLIMVMVINLTMGFAIDGIDNAAHIGGAITGAVLASIFVMSQRLYPWGVGVLITLFFGVWYWLHTALMAVLK
ncbi:MAG: rhomboid family intramembrane serine protease [Moraxella sp.]|nr:rhomboid family intramembrane serine protease [Moraxella sp.]